MLRLRGPFWGGRLKSMRFFRSDTHPDRPHIRRPWAVTAIGRLMLLQGLGLLFLAWLMAPQSATPTFDEAWLGGSFGLLGLLALISSVSLLRLRANARDRALLFQGLTLLLALFLYSVERPAFIYAMMVYSIFLVLYLQHPDVIACFPYERPEVDSGPRR